MDEDGDPVSNVRVEIEGSSTFTNAQGDFSIQSVMLSPEGAFVKASQTGLISTGTRIYPSSSLIANTLIVMPKDITYFTFESAQSATYLSPDDIEISFQANSITKDGNPYNGEVALSIVYQNISEIPSEEIALKASEIDTESDGERSLLNAQSIVEIQLKDPNGELLNIDPSMPASAKIPMSDQRNGNSINQYTFDFDKGLWVDEGPVTINNNVAIVYFSHFSWDGYGLPADAITLNLSFNPVNGEAVEGDHFLITNNEIEYLVFGNIDYNESFCVPVPANSDININVYGFCGRRKTTSNYTTGDSDKADLEIDVDQAVITYSIAGNLLDCDGNVNEREISLAIKDAWRFNVAERFTGSFDYTLDQCIDISRAKLVLFDPIDKSVRELSLAELAPGSNELDIEICKENSDGNGTLIEIGGAAFINAVARKNKEETLVTIDGEVNPILFGFDGFSKGVFDCRIYFNSKVYEGQVTITAYGDLGEDMEGSFVATNPVDVTEQVEGSIIATRIK